MKEKVYNKHNISKDKIYDTITRVKIILIDSNDDITLAFSDNVYHFVGGHVEKKETLNDALIREVEEETGIILENKTYEPFYKITQIFKDYPSIGKHNCYEYYYYEIKTDELPNIDNVHYTQDEKDDNFELRKINLNKIEEELKNTLSWSEKNKNIALTMLEAIEVYKNIK